jgi:hypothetical protein
MPMRSIGPRFFSAAAAAALHFGLAVEERSGGGHGMARRVEPEKEGEVLVGSEKQCQI